MSKDKLNREEIKKRFEVLLSGKTLSSQQRGLEFEKLIFSILENESLEPRASYKPEGEQVDGSFYWQGQTFLIEAKWVKDPIPASSIYAFKGKLDGKFHTTSGVFISVNGYSDAVEDALRFGKSLNILLFDDNDVKLIFNGEVGFLEVLKYKLREAGDTGSVQVPYKLKEKAEEISRSAPVELEYSGSDFDIEIPKNKKAVDDLIVFVEGKSDVAIIKNFIEPIKSLYSLSYKIHVLNGVNNIRQLPSLLNLYGDYENVKAVITILDADMATSNIESLIKNVTEQLLNSSISVKPIFLFINENLKEKLREKALSLKMLRRESVFERLEFFIQEIEEDYYDPEQAIPHEALINELARLEWDLKEKTIYGYDENGRHSIDSLEELIEHLNEVMIQAMQGEMPMSWLKEQESLDYESDVREYLSENCTEDIEAIGWDSDDL
jgi:hypothetical protein